jgi:uncharacterized protein
MTAESTFLTASSSTSGFVTAMLRAMSRFSQWISNGSALRTYACYRALVRAKVESLRSLEREVPADDRESARNLTRKYLALACRYARCYDGRTVVIVVCGAAGTGKSTLARALGSRLGLKALNSDEARKRLAGVSPTTSLKAAYGGGVYSEEFTRQTYDTLIRRARGNLEDGAGIILDATFRHPEERRRVMDLAEQSSALAMFVECRADEAEVKRRLHERSQQPGSISDADAGVYLRQRADFVPLDEIPPECRMVVDTCGSEETILTAVEQRIVSLCASRPFGDVLPKPVEHGTEESK